jgi:hypothetical protein
MTHWHIFFFILKGLPSLCCFRFNEGLLAGTWKTFHFKIISKRSISYDGYVVDCSAVTNSEKIAVSGSDIAKSITSLAERDFLYQYFQKDS